MLDDGLDRDQPRIHGYLRAFDSVQMGGTVMGEWWKNLSQLNQAFFAAAAFFSVFFLWQLIAALTGIGGGESDVEDVDLAEDFDADLEADAAEAVTSFKLLSIRSVISFFTLFSWAGALYLYWGHSPSPAMAYSLLWGLAGMFGVALVFYALRKLSKAETGDLRTCIGQHGTVYLDIPADGKGEVRVPVSGVLSHVKARSTTGKELKGGTPVRVARLLDRTTIEVEPTDPGE